MALPKNSQPRISTGMAAAQLAALANSKALLALSPALRKPCLLAHREAGSRQEATGRPTHAWHVGPSLLQGYTAPSAQVTARKLAGPTVSPPAQKGSMLLAVISTATPAATLARPDFLRLGTTAGPPVLGPPSPAAAPALSCTQSRRRTMGAVQRARVDGSMRSATLGRQRRATYLGANPIRSRAVIV